MNSVKQLGYNSWFYYRKESTPAVLPEEHAIDALKHLHIDKASVKDLMIPMTSARMGTPGEWSSVNGVHEPRIPPAARNDSTAYCECRYDHLSYYEGAEAWVIAIDGNPVKTPAKLIYYKNWSGHALISDRSLLKLVSELTFSK